MLSIRSLAVSDCKAILRINAASLPGVAALDEAEFTRLLAMPNHHLAVENERRVVMGYALAFNGRDPYDGEEFQAFRRKSLKSFIYIDQVATQVEWRKMGVGSAVYDALENTARLTGAATLCCEVNIEPPNPDSMVFHRNRGFNGSEILHTTDGRKVALLFKDVG